ncbi:hypothetical protein EDC94DRAFT_661752 [Helicostylum pulchrum]|nr:hypothetical protein EDC94DRAFT_661752 [Helicostylum pulchrum]
MICIRAERRYGKLDFSKVNENFPNKSASIGCSCDDVENTSSDNEHSTSYSRHACSFCVRTFSTATRLYLHTSNAHHTNDTNNQQWDFYSVVGNSIIGNLDFFYYDQDKLNRLSSLIEALQMNVCHMKKLTTIYE